ncbi:hypothetical protein [Enterococcus dongliensis]|uniref:hypothetical protein n=1 Tax=Enterococcus dongliensis TaxID=2559925 RepID=UPI00288E86D4|nr:hypothetical protein [Enterococcus dongliensis]MDT2668488.1 hypothetical protein [Enterococcus dongliensis]
MEIIKATDIDRADNFSVLIYAPPGGGKTYTANYLKGKTLVIDIVPTKEYVKPTGEYESYNFQKEVQIKKALGTEKKLAKLCGNGINLAYRFTDPDFMRIKIELKNDAGDNRLTIRSNQEACVVYTLNSIDDPVILNQEIPIEPFMGITFEMQQIPNHVHEKKDHLCQKYSSITTYEIN